MDKQSETTSPEQPVGSLQPLTVQPATETHQTGMSLKKPGKRWRLIALLIGLVLALAAILAVAWYFYSLQPVDSNGEPRQVVIEAGTAPDAIASQLKESGVIRSTLAFTIYTRLENVRNTLQAGSYQLSPAQSTPEVVDDLTQGRVDDTNEMTVHFYPGSALRVALNPNDSTPSHKQVLLSLGYSDQEIEAAFSTQYDHPLLADKPASASLEGYIYGVQYQMSKDATVEEVLLRNFDLYNEALTDELRDGFRQHNLNSYEAITLASIIQREVSTESDQRQVAQIFYKRLAEGMSLGADATFVYAALINGDTPSVDYDSPYNTRRYGGLPPGPIASPKLSALQAVASPASGDFLYFVSGDDGTTHFARTAAEHESNTRQYCQVNCQLF